MGLDVNKLLVIAVIAVFLIGPERLPGYAEKLAQLVRRFRSFADDTKERVKDELGEDFSEEDWRKLDPRRYDPRRIIQQALLEGEPGAGAAAGAAAAAGMLPGQSQGTGEPLGAGQTPPYDSEAT